MRLIVEAQPPKQENGKVVCTKNVKGQNAKGALAKGVGKGVPKTSPTQPAEAQNDGKKKKTPYQGRQRTYGSFRCTECKKQWSSVNSWANMGQECTDCRINIYPYRQKPFSKVDLPDPVRPKKNNGEEKQHPKEFCEKCKTLGYSCQEELIQSKTKKKKNKKNKKNKKMGKATTPNP